MVRVSDAQGGLANLTRALQIVPNPLLLSTAEPEASNLGHMFSLAAELSHASAANSSALRGAKKALYDKFYAAKDRVRSGPMKSQLIKLMATLSEGGDIFALASSSDSLLNEVAGLDLWMEH